MAFRELGFARLSEDESRRRVEAFLREVRTRRSVRDFAPDPVPQDIVDAAIAAAASAPSGANRQPWRFVLVGDPEAKARFREAAEAEETVALEDPLHEDARGVDAVGVSSWPCATNSYRRWSPAVLPHVNTPGGPCIVR